MRLKISLCGVVIFASAFSMMARPPELVNFGNSCYINAILQALFAANPLTRALPNITFNPDSLGDIYKRLMESFNVGDKVFINTHLFYFYKALKNMTNIVGDAIFQSIEPIQSLEDLEKEKKNIEKKRKLTDIERATLNSLNTFIKESKAFDALAENIAINSEQKPDEVKNILRSFFSAPQQDAQEFLSAFINQLVNQAHEAQVINKIFFYKPYHFSDKIYRHAEGDQEIREIIGRIEPAESILNLALADTLEEALVQHFSTSTQDYEVDGEKLGDQRIQRTIYEPSELLIIKINRFSHNAKKQNRMETPTLLDIKAFMTPDYEEMAPENVVVREVERIEPDNESTYYELVAVVIHRGKTMQQGHYIAYVKEQGAWYLCNDENITMVSLSSHSVKTEINTNGYILFYQQISPEQWQGRLLEKQLEEEVSKQLVDSLDNLTAQLHNLSGLL